MRLASAPVTWGVWERTIDRDDLVPAERLLEAVRSLGLDAIELGPLGYFGSAAAGVSAAFEPYGMELAGAFVPLHLADEEAFRLDLPELDQTIGILAGTPGGGVVLVADAGSPERLRAAGKPDALHRTALGRDELARAAERVTRAAERCRERGVPMAFHHHTESYFEAPAEIEALLERTEVGLCLDTGHALVGGGEPIALARDWAERLAHLHLKDVGGAVLARLRRGEIDVETAWAEGLFCPFGEGEVDLAGFLALPEILRFDGWGVLEQDRIAVRVGDLDAVRAVEERNLAFVSARLGEAST